MITGQIKNQIDQIWETFWTGGIINSVTLLEQMSYLLFMKMLDDFFDAFRYEGKITVIVQALKKHGTVPQVMAKGDVINEVLTPNFWDNKSLASVEKMRIELRDLLQFPTGNSDRTFDVNIDDKSSFKGEAGAINSTMTYRQKAVDRFTDFISTNQLTSEQEEYLESILNYVCQNGDIQVDVLLTELPFDDADEDSIFPGKFYKVGEFVTLRHNLITAA